MSNEFVARKGLVIHGIANGATETNYLVVDSNDVVKYRSLSAGVNGTSGSSGSSGISGGGGGGLTGGTANYLVKYTSLTQSTTSIITDIGGLIGIGMTGPYLVNAAGSISMEVPFASGGVGLRLANTGYSDWSILNRVNGAGMGIYCTDYGQFSFQIFADGTVYLGGNTYTNNTASITATVGGRVGLINNSPSAYMHLPPGLTYSGYAPLKFTVGVTGNMMLTPEHGAVEFDGQHYFGTIGSTRHQLDQQLTGSNGSVIFIGATGYPTQNNTKFYWNNTSNRLAIGSTVTNAPLHIATTDPAIAMRQDTTGQEFKFRVGYSSGISNSRWNLIDTTANKVRMSFSGQTFMVGNVASSHNSPQSLIYGFGGQNGANFDMRPDPDGGGYDEANIEVENKDYDGVTYTGYGLAMQHNGTASFGTVMGYPIQLMSQLRFTADTNIIRVINTAALRFGTSNVERGMIGASGEWGFGCTAATELVTIGTPGSIPGVLSLAGASSGKAILQVGVTAGTPTLTLPGATGTLSNFLENSIASSGTPTPVIDARDNYYDITALAAGAAFAAPTGTALNHSTLLIRIKDDGTARALSWDGIYRAGTDFALPTTTVISKTIYIQFIYNSADSKWDAIGLSQGF